jgi:hypothetical protein
LSKIKTNFPEMGKNDLKHLIYKKNLLKTETKMTRTRGHMAPTAQGRQLLPMGKGMFNREILAM